MGPLSTDLKLVRSARLIDRRSSPAKYRSTQVGISFVCRRNTKEALHLPSLLGIQFATYSLGLALPYFIISSQFPLLVSFPLFSELDFIYLDSPHWCSKLVDVKFPGQTYLNHRLTFTCLLNNTTGRTIDSPYLTIFIILSKSAPPKVFSISMVENTIFLLG